MPSDKTASAEAAPNTSPARSPCATDNNMKDDSDVLSASDLRNRLESLALRNEGEDKNEPASLENQPEVSSTFPSLDMEELEEELDSYPPHPSHNTTNSNSTTTVPVSVANANANASVPTPSTSTSNLATRPRTMPPPSTDYIKWLQETPFKKAEVEVPEDIRELSSEEYMDLFEITAAVAEQKIKEESEE